MGHYIAVEYYAGPRQPADLLAFLSHAGQLLARWGWDKLISEHGQMAPLSPAEAEWLTAFWHSQKQPQAAILYGALLLPHDMFVRLSWRAKVPVAVSPLPVGCATGRHSAPPAGHGRGAGYLRPQ